MYVATLNMYFAEGRAEAAAKLHLVQQRQQLQSVTEDGADKWMCRGQGGLWKRLHNTWRLALFTPFKVPRGPTQGSRLLRYRRTDGVYHDGEAFTWIDDWSDNNGHALLSRAWRGTTSFVSEGEFRAETSAGANPWGSSSSSSCSSSSK